MADLTQVRSELHEILLKQAFLFAEEGKPFTLTSGKLSMYYFDGRKVTLDGRGLSLIAQMMLPRCHELGVSAIGGLTLGADPIAAGVAMLSAQNGDPLRAFIVRKQTKEHGTGRAIEGPPLQAGERVAIVDDVVTTGGSLLTALEKVREAGANVVEALTILDRDEGGREALKAQGVPLHALYSHAEFSRPSQVANAS